MTALRCMAYLVFVAALVTWGRLAIRSMDHAETWPQTRQRTAAFVMMMGAGLASIVLAPKKGEADEEEAF